MQTVRIALGERSYDIHIGAGLLARAELMAAVLPQPRAAVVTNTTVAPLYLDALSAALARSGVGTVPIVLPAATPLKTWKTRFFHPPKTPHLTVLRRTAVIALG